MPKWIGGPIGAVGAVAPPPVNVIVTPSTGALVATGFAPSILVGSSMSPFRTMIGVWGLPQNLWGVAPTPDNVLGNSNGAAFTQTNGYIDKATAQGGCFFAKVPPGGNSNQKNPNGSFSVTLWKANFTSFWSGAIGVAGGLAKIRTAVRNGVWRGCIGWDDFTTGGNQGNGYLNAVTYDEIEECCQWVKTTASGGLNLGWMPMVARGPTTYLKQTAQASGPGPRIGGVRQYQYLDSGYSQYRARLDGAIGAYVTNQIQAGEDCAIATIGGANLLNQGKGTTPGWGCIPANAADQCGQSPTEMRESGFAFLARPEPVGYLLWEYEVASTGDHSYFERAGIVQARQDVYNASIGRPEGLINIRGDLTPA